MLAPYFEEQGYPCPSNFNPADHVMFLLQKEPAEKIRKLKDSWVRSGLHQELLGRIDSIAGRSETDMTTPSSATAGTRRVGFFSQLIVLTARELRGTLRNKGALIARYGMSVFLAGMYGWLFAGSARNGDSTSGGNEGNCLKGPTFNTSGCQADFQAHFGTVISLAIAAMMGAAQPILLLFPSERPVFLREYAANQYGVVAYFISKTLVEMPVLVGTQVVTFLVAYWLMGLHGNFILMVLLSWLLGLASASISLIVGCGVASAQKAMQLAPLALIPQMLFSGLFIPVQKIPASLRWVKYICPLKYAIDLLELEEFRYVHDAYDKCVALHGEPYCEMNDLGNALRLSALKAQSVDYDDYTFDLYMLICLFVAFRIYATFLLWRKGKYVY
jgi:hypothetical protein